MPVCRVLVLLVLSVSPIAAADLPLVWQTDYNTARKLAQETGKPLLLQIGTEQCVYCRKLEATTFRDPLVQAIMRDYVLLKVDGHRDVALTQMLKVTIYPTTVLAGSDGSIHTYVAGYVGVEKFLEPLTRTRDLVLADTKLATELAAARAAIKSAEYAKAVPTLQRLALVAKGKPIEPQVKELLAEIERSADARIALVERLPADQQRAAFTSVAAMFPGTAAAVRAEQQLQTLTTASRTLTPIRAASVLVAAKELSKSGEYAEALTMCEILAKTDEAVGAKLLADEIRNDPVRLATATRQLAEKSAEIQLSLAEAWTAKGDTASAVQCYELALQLNPKSAKAGYVQGQLTMLRNKPQGLEAIPTARGKN